MFSDTYHVSLSELKFILLIDYVSEGKMVHFLFHNSLSKHNSMAPSRVLLVYAISILSTDIFLCE